MFAICRQLLSFIVADVVNLRHSEICSFIYIHGVYEFSAHYGRDISAGKVCRPFLVRHQSVGGSTSIDAVFCRPTQENYQLSCYVDVIDEGGSVFVCLPLGNQMWLNTNIRHAAIKLSLISNGSVFLKGSRLTAELWGRVGCLSVYMDFCAVIELF